MLQPIPSVTSNDVERIVRRDYSETQFDSVMAVLKGYEERSSGRRERPRVQLAALKLANGDVKALRAHIDSAVQDFRDVLGPAEYPEYSKKVAFRRPKPPIDEEQRIIHSDWKQYEAWLQR
ncbi:MAG: hypothetical protein ABSB14_03370 [Candidatus Sulfotelmatobacter sp.]|jgi:hypothetical protein